MRSVLPVVALYTVEPDLSVPRNTFITFSLPTKGSTTVLNTCAANGPSSVQETPTSSSLSTPEASISRRSSALGMYFTISSIRLMMPRFCSAEPAITGMVLTL